MGRIPVPSEAKQTFFAGFSSAEAGSGLAPNSAERWHSPEHLAFHLSSIWLKTEEKKRRFGRSVGVTMATSQSFSSLTREELRSLIQEKEKELSILRKLLEDSESSGETFVRIEGLQHSDSVERSASNSTFSSLGQSATDDSPSSRPSQSDDHSGHWHSTRIKTLAGEKRPPPTRSPVDQLPVFKSNMASTPMEFKVSAGGWPFLPQFPRHAASRF
jgi:hypothetical protein